MVNTDKEIGKKYGRLTVVMYDATVNHVRKYLCQCDCGVIKSVSISKLRSGWTKSCGCLQRETASKVSLKHGDAKDNQWSRIYSIWHGILQRCKNPNRNNFASYGGRGIKVCDEWLDYETFRNWALNHGYDSTLTIDRIDVNGNYCPENCRWATRKQQDRNKTVNHLLTLGGKTQCIVQWCEELNLNPNTLHKRLKMGWSVEKALLTPVKINKTKGENNG